MTWGVFLQTAKPFQLGDGWVLFQPDVERLAILNNSGGLVWHLLSEGHGVDDIASVFAQQFGLPVEQARADVQDVITGLEGLESAGASSAAVGPDRHLSSTTLVPDRTKSESGVILRCGTFRFGEHWIQVQLHASLIGISIPYFLRFQHRIADEAIDVANLDLSLGPSGYCLGFQGKVVAEVASPPELIARANNLLLKLEHPSTDFLAYFHAAALVRGQRSILLPGISGVGKSTLTAYLAGHGFAYLGDDLIAMAVGNRSLRPLPTCLCLKSGSWPVMEPFYPQLPQLPIMNCHGREVRYIEPGQTLGEGGAPSVIVFPSYVKGGGTRLSPLTSLHTMARLLETSTDLVQPVTEDKLLEFLRFVEETPAYELSYSELAGAMDAIEDLLETDR